MSAPVTDSSSLPLPLPLESYPAVEGSLLDVLAARVDHFPFNAVATGVFLLAVLHTLFANHFLTLSYRVQAAENQRRSARRLEAQPSVLAEVLHFLGEVEVVFGLWVVVLLAAIAVWFDWHTAERYMTEGVNFTEAMFVVVIMAVAAARPVVRFAESGVRRLAALGGATPAAWWLAILTVGPLLGSFITEPAAMTISAVLLGRQFYQYGPSVRLAYATLGLLFVNISIGGTLTQFAAPPVLMVARPWNWSLGFMAGHFGWKAVLAIVVSNGLLFLAFRRELASLADRVSPVGAQARSGDVPVPAWITTVHLLFIAWTVFQAHHPALFVGGFLFYLGFTKATAPYQSAVDLRSPILVGFFLGGLVTHGTLQGWWIAPVLGSLSPTPLFFGAGALTAFNDNALITYLATLVPDLTDVSRYAVVAGAVAGGGLTVIANAPNPAGQALLGRFFPGGVSPVGLAAGALVPTAVAALAFQLL